jgi:hypothetical protein
MQTESLVPDLFASLKNWLVGFSLIIVQIGGLPVANANQSKKVCARLLDEVVLPPKYLAALKRHPLSDLSRRLSSGQGFFMFNGHLLTKKALAKISAQSDRYWAYYMGMHWPGEVRQSHFLSQILKALFPKSDGNHLAPNEVGLPSNRVMLEVFEAHAEMEGSTSNRVDGKTIEMSRLKAANPSGFGLSKARAFASYGLNPKLNLLHIYVSSIARFDEGEWDQLIVDLRKMARFDAIIVSSNSFGINEPHDRRTLRKFAGKFSNWVKDPTKFAAGSLIRNDTRGQMSLIHAVSRAVVVAGPINWFEPLVVKTPTVIYVPPGFSQNYRMDRFDLIVDQAERTGGARRVHSLYEVVGTLAEWTVSAPKMTMPGLTEGLNGKTPFDLLLDDLYQYLLWDEVVKQRIEASSTP